MSNDEPTMLGLSWSTSRGRETYGYNICRLDDYATGKRYKCMGGGYDMVGTVLGLWLQDVHQDRLQAISDRADVDYNIKDDPNGCPGYYGRRKRLYGLIHTGGGGMRVDGACGVESVIRIAKAAGITIKRAAWDKRGNTTAYLATLDAEARWRTVARSGACTHCRPPIAVWQSTRKARSTRPSWPRHCATDTHKPLRPCRGWSPLVGP